jgi:hypothetical protein
MRPVAKRPQLLAYLNGMPDVESTYPVLERLHKRGKVDVRAIVYSKLLRNETRLPDAFAAHGLVPQASSKLRMKLLFQRDIRKSDAVLTIADPFWDSTTRKQRGTYMRKIGKPSIFLQHGAYQLGVNGSLTEGKMPYYSEKLLFWEALGANRSIFVDDVISKVEVVGFVKQNILPERTWPAEVTAWKARYKRRLLVCQSFRWGKGRYHKDDIQSFYDLIETVVKRNPDLGIIIRPHRGKVRQNHRNYDKYLQDKYPSVLFSKYHSGPLAKATIHDTLALCDAMVSPTSTTVLDCVYAGKPAAVFDEGLDIFPGLMQIADADGLERFLDQIDRPGPEQAQLITRFGTFTDNLDRAAESIERHLSPVHKPVAE